MIRNSGSYSELELTLVWVRAVQIHPVTRSTRKTDRNRPESGRPDCSGGSAADLHHQKPIPADRFRFSSPKTRKIRTDRKISRFRPKFPDPGKHFQFPVRIFQNPAKNPDSGDISLRSSEILTGSCEISSNPVRLSPESGKLSPESGFLRRICVFFTVFSPSSQIYDSDRPARHPFIIWTARPDYSAGRRRVDFSPTRFRRVGSGLGTNPTRTDSWTPLDEYIAL